MELLQHLHPDFKEFLELLNAHSVRYLVVGGYAVAFHGYPRATGDIDIWIEIAPDNANQMVRVVRDFGFGGLGYTAADFQEPGTVIQFGVSPIRIDILTEIDGVSFPTAFALRETPLLDGIPVSIISLHDLQRNKAATGRAQDQVDLARLTAPPADPT